MNRTWTCIALGMLAAVASVDALAQAYPARPIRIIVGFAPGGAIDQVARLAAKKFTDNLGQAGVVENRVGAGGAIATDAVVKSPADGYTLAMLSTAITTLPALRPLPFDIQRDLAPIGMLASGASILVVNAAVPAQNLKELIALARSQPGKFGFGSSGIGTATHLMGILFNQMAQVEVMHVPFNSSADSAKATASGDVAVGFMDVSSALPLIKAGRIRPLATVGAKRLNAMPTLPTIGEAGLPGYEYSIWYGLSAPSGVSKDIVARLNTLLAREMNAPDAASALNGLGLQPQTGSPEEFAAQLRRDLELNARLVKLSGAKDE